MKNLLMALTLVATTAFTSAQALALELTEKDVENFIKAAPAVTNWADKQGQQFDGAALLGAQGSEQNNKSMSDSAIAMLKNTDSYQQFADVISRYGFTPEQLISVGSEVTAAYLANVKGDLSAEDKARVDEVMGGLQSLSGSSNKTNSLLGAIGSANQASEDVSDTNIALVEEYMPQLKKLFSVLGQ
ncbi:short-chain dehydrogenase [Pseudoalteromonas sp. CNC9-20]|uniref:short-chain dehydrogenase n=1 Tax=Pseudoalteromonas sp. CNC9-20 TaxID=2917750 RepID=UPI001EF49544|nr:short-chain dehydrogenase [Pseudoalteromonas sp. CNC9-20]MCG7569129.1 short-chain dehydrogenase [Pseudoalteromonas sp. CNC9-20]